MDESMDIQQLVNRSGVQRRNIYFYVQQGILPAPEGAGLGARYGEEHLLRLRLIPILRREGLRLDQIREQLSAMSADVMRARLADEPHPALLPQPSTPPPVAFTAGEACLRIDLPGGMQLIVPAQLTAENRLRLERILAAAGVPVLHKA